MDKLIEKAVIEHFDIPKEISDLARLANFDLYFGPLSEDQLEDGDEWHGFVSACSAISGWARENVGTLYVECDAGFVSTQEPQGEWVSAAEYGMEIEDIEDGEEEIYIEPPDYYMLETREVLTILFGSELAYHL